MPKCVADVVTIMYCWIMFNELLDGTVRFFAKHPRNIV